MTEVACWFQHPFVRSDDTNQKVPAQKVGGTNDMLPEPVRQAMNVPMQDHRAHDFGAPNVQMFRDLKALFRTKEGQVLVFPSSGTGAWEAAITNTLNPGDRVLIVLIGHGASATGGVASRMR